MNGDQYILSFDLSEINRQVSELQNSYKVLADSFSGSSTEVQDKLSVIEDNVTRINTSLNDSFTSMDQFYEKMLGNLKNTIDYFKQLEEYSLSVSENLTKLNDIDLAKLKSGTGDPDDTAQERIAAIDPEEGGSRFRMSMEISAETDEMAEEALGKAEKAIQSAQKALKEAQESQNLIVSTTKKLTNTIKQEVKSGKGAMMGIASRGTMGIVGGGLLTGLIGMMILGVKEKQRMGAERGEMVNVFEAIGDAFTKESRKAVGWFARFAEHAQWYFGIGRKEIQSVVKQMVDAGYQADEILTDFSAKVTDVEANVTSLTIGIDKHLNAATGTSMNKVISLVENYGDELDEAADKYKRLAFEAQRSGMGVGKFVDAIMAGSSALTQYGIEMEDVVQVMGKLQDYYESMGLTKQFAGGQAAQAVKGIVGGIAGLDEGTMAALAQRMFGALGLNAIEAIQMFKEGAARVASGQDKDFLIEAATTLRDMAEEASGGRRAVGIRFLESRGLNNQQATALYDVADKLEKGTRIDELSVQEQEMLRKAFVTEGKQLSELQKTQRSLIKGLSKIGEGLLKVLTGLLGTIIVGIKSLPAAIKAAVTYITDPSAGKEQFEALENALSEQLSGIGDGASLMYEGGKQTAGALGDALGDIGTKLEKAVKFDPGGIWAAMGDTLDQATDAISQIMSENEARDLWLEELQASFDRRINAIGEALGLVTEEQVRHMEELDRERLDAATARLRGEKGTTRKRGEVLNRSRHTFKGIVERYPGKVQTKIDSKHLAKSIEKQKLDIVN